MGLRGHNDMGLLPFRGVPDFHLDDRLKVAGYQDSSVRRAGATAEDKHLTGAQESYTILISSVCSQTTKAIQTKEEVRIGKRPKEYTREPIGNA